MPARLADGLGLGSVRLPDVVQTFRFANGKPKGLHYMWRCAPGARVPRVLRVAQDLGRRLFYAFFEVDVRLKADATSSDGGPGGGSACRPARTAPVSG